jgi:hypothetical protein
MTLTALYYPYITISNEAVLKNALLLWDHIETIGPTIHSHRNHEIAQASELVVRGRIPNDREYKTVETAISKILKSSVPAQLRSPALPGWTPPPGPLAHHPPPQEYLFHASKFPPRIWRLLFDAGVARLVPIGPAHGLSLRQIAVPPGIALILMSLLADACAGTQIQKITDEVPAYAWLGRHHAELLGTSYVTGLDVSQVAPAYDRLVTLSLELLDARSVPLHKLIEMRKREVRSGGQDYAQLRRRYFNTLQLHLKRLASEAKSQRDVVELQDQFKKQMAQDLHDLKTELRIATASALLSKEMALSVLIGAGSMFFPVAGMTGLATTVGGVGIIPLLKTAVDFRGERRRILAQHQMSWLLLGKKRRLTRT